jgi:lipopolysaccharide transport system ATP-binding protein
MEYDVLKPGYVLLPHFHLLNEDSVHLFAAHDLDPEWRGRKRPAGRYISAAWLPGNLLAEGMIFVDANMLAIEPYVFQYWNRGAVAFLVKDCLEGDSARGDWTGHMPGVMRPLLRWTTQTVTEHAAAGTR